jgi:hypothetical protein
MECSLAPGRPYLWQTSSEGDDIHIIDIEARAIVGRLVVGPEPHGIAAPRDGHIVYVSIEANGQPHGELLGIDPTTLEVSFRLKVGPEPHAIATTPDGRWVYVPCRDGHYWVIDAGRRQVLHRIHTGGRPHNTSISRDGRLAYLSPMGRSMVTIVDITNNHRVVGTISFSNSVRPPALSSDGHQLFQHVDGLNGFEVAHTGRQRIDARVEHSMPLGWLLVHGELGWLDSDGLHRCHGLVTRPAHSELWSACGSRITIHSTESPYRELSWFALSDDAYWLTFSPDGRYAFVPVRDEWSVAMVDAASTRVLARFDVGPAPKRNLVVTTPRS